MSRTTRHPYLTVGSVLLIGVATLAGATQFAAHTIVGTGATAPASVRKLDQPTSMVPGYARTTVRRRLDQTDVDGSGHCQRGEGRGASGRATRGELRAMSPPRPSDAVHLDT